MIAIPKRACRKPSPEHNGLFLVMLPKITEMARIAFREMTPEAKQEATAQVVASVYVMFISLVQQGREALACRHRVRVRGATARKGQRAVSFGGPGRCLRAPPTGVPSQAAASLDRPVAELIGSPFVHHRSNSQ